MISENKQQTNIAKFEKLEAFVDSTGTKGANLEDKFLFYVFVAFSITKMERKATNRHVFLRMVGEVYVARYFFA